MTSLQVHGHTPCHTLKHGFVPNHIILVYVVYICLHCYCLRKTTGRQLHSFQSELININNPYNTFERVRIGNTTLTTQRAQWFRTLNWENPVSNSVVFFHSTLHQFTQLYKWVPGYRQWWICVCTAFRTLIVACAWMLPREVEIVFDWTGMSGK